MRAFLRDPLWYIRHGYIPGWFYLYRSEICRSGTIILWRFAYRWGCHKSLGRFTFYR